MVYGWFHAEGQFDFAELSTYTPTEPAVSFILFLFFYFARTPLAVAVLVILVLRFEDGSLSLEI